MDDDTVEAVGFLCRWCLLALAGGAAVFVVALAAATAYDLPASLAAGVVLPDDLWGTKNPDPPHVIGYISADLRGQEILLVVAGNGARDVPHYRGRIFPAVPRGGSLEREVRLKGVPYGPYAFERRAAWFEFVEPDRPVVLLDARWLLSSLADDPEDTRALLADLRRRGVATVAFHPGPLDEFSHARAGLRKAGVEIPVLCLVYKEPVSPRVLYRAAGALRRVVTVATADEGLARTLAGDNRERFRVYLLGEGDTPTPPRLFRARGPANLKESLAGAPIPQ